MSQYINSRSKLLRHIDRIAALKAGMKPPPVNVEIDLSNRCSLGCEWCHFAHTHTRGPLSGKRTVDAGDLMNTQLAFTIIYDLEHYGVRSVVWSGGGEPTLHPEFNRIISTCRLPQGLYTNGGHIDDKRAAILKSRMSWVYVSLDAASGDEYAKVKGVTPAHFDRAVAGITALVEAGGEATVGVGFLLNEYNWHAAPRMAALGVSLGADYVQFRPTILYDTDHPASRVGDVSWVSKAARILEGLSTRHTVEIDISRFKMLQHWREHGYSTCWWSGMQTVITPNGKVWACLNKRGMDGAELGDLNTEFFDDVWQRAPIQAVNEQCRVMCRGHIPNLELSAIMEDRLHGEFI